MKSIFFYCCTGLLSLLLFSGCYKDKGNYNYTAINEVTISGIDSTYTANYGDVFTLKPTLAFSKDQAVDTSRYTYEWIASLPVGSVANTDTLSTEKDLSVRLQLTSGSYYIYYRVTDKQTGVAFSKQFNLVVVTTVYEGWLLLSEVNNGSRLDMLSKGTSGYKPIYDVLGTIGAGLTLTGTPVDVKYAKLSSLSTGTTIYVSTTGGTNRLDPETFKYKAPLQTDFLSNLPAGFYADPIFCRSAGGLYTHGSDGNMYYYLYTYQIYFGLPINVMYGETTTFTTAPFIGYYNSSSLSSSYPNVLYDTDNKRFVKHLYSAPSSCTQMPAGTLFDYNTGKDLLYMETSRFNNGDTYAVLDSAHAGYFLARFNITSGTIAQTYYDSIAATDFDKAEHFAISADMGYLFYNVGGKLYEYDMSIHQSKLMLDYGSKKISFLKCDGFMSATVTAAKNYYDKLQIGVYDPALPSDSCGSFELYTIPGVNGDLSLVEQYTGFGKIKSVTYRER